MSKRPRPLDLLRHPWVLPIVTSGTILLLLAFLLLRYEGFLSAFSAVLCTLRPLLLGLLYATVLNRPFRRFERDIAASRLHLSERLCRLLALSATVLLVGLALTGLICILVPELVASVQALIDNFAFYRQNLTAWLQRYRQWLWPDWLQTEWVRSLLQSIQGYVPELLLKTYDVTADWLACVVDIGIGAIFSFYLLADQVRLKRQLRQIGERLCGTATVDRLAKTARMACHTFAGFLTSQCMESLILGGLCYGGMRLFGFSYPVLLSVILGITNIVPYVGPILGTIPCALILLLAQPKSVLWFLLFVLVLQQIESNLIYPRIVGHSIGLPPAWVLAAIVIGGGFFGIGGMLIGVPLTAVLYALLFSEQDV